MNTLNSFSHWQLEIHVDRSPEYQRYLSRELVANGFFNRNAIEADAAVLPVRRVVEIDTGLAEQQFVLHGDR